MNLCKLIESAPDTIRSSISYQYFQKGSHIFYPEEKNVCLFFLLDGEAEVYQYTVNGMFILLHQYRRNSCFGEVELFCSNRTTLGIVACKDCKVATITKETVLNWATKDVNFCKFLLEQMAAKIAKNSDAYIQRSSMTLKERILYCLYRHFQFGTLSTLNKEKLSSEICTPIRSINRILVQCREEGLIDYQKHQFIILDIDAVRRSVDKLF